jgi:hypothetical protein
VSPRSSAALEIGPMRRQEELDGLPWHSFGVAPAFYAARLRLDYQEAREDLLDRASPDSCRIPSMLFR